MTPVELAFQKLAILQRAIDFGEVICWRAGRITRIYLTESRGKR
jgi:hypothetical protein